MWIIEPPKNLNKKQSGRDNLNFLFQEDKFYIMDNHLAAGWCWMQRLNPKETYNLFHIDQHLDLWNETPYEAYQHIKENPFLSIEELTQLEYIDKETKKKEKVYNFANYILITNNLFPQWFNKCFFACNAYCQNKNDIHINYNPYSYELPFRIGEWLSEINLQEEKEGSQQANQWILNLDIDYFFLDNRYQLYTDEYIKELCINIKKCIDKIEVMTIALSPECCGGWKNAIRVTNLVTSILEIDFHLEL